MESKLNSWYIITTPEDCKEVIKDNAITVGKEEQEFKEGDFYTVKTSYGNYVFIYKSNKENNRVYYYALSLSGLKLPLYNSSCLASKYETSVSTKEEKQMLLDAMHADVKDWDADKKQIVDYKWKPNYREVYYHVNCSFEIRIESCYWSDDALDIVAFNNGNCFVTKEEAQKYADKFVELLKERKL